MDVVAYFRWAETNFNSGRVSLGKDFDNPGWARPVPVNHGAPEGWDFPTRHYDCCPICWKSVSDRYFREHVEKCQADYEAAAREKIEKAESRAKAEEIARGEVLKRVRENYRTPAPWEEDETSLPQSPKTPKPLRPEKQHWVRVNGVKIRKQKEVPVPDKPRYAWKNTPVDLDTLPQKLKDLLLLEIRIEMELRRALHRKP